MINNLLDQIHKQFPGVVGCVSDAQNSFIFFDDHGLPKLSVVIKSITGPQIVVELFDYDKKLTKENL